MQTISEYLQFFIERENIFVPWQIVQDTTQHTLLLTFQIPLQSDERDCPTLFELKLLFANNRSHYAVSDIFKVIELSADMSIEIGALLAIIKYVKTLIHELRILQFEYQLDNHQTLTLQWQAQVFEKIKQQLIQRNEYSQNSITLS